MHGRKPKPTARRRLEGNLGKRPYNDNEPDPPAPPSSAVPAELLDEPVAKAEWARLAPMLEAIRVLTSADRTALMALCLEWARYLEATDKIRHLGMVVKAPSGYPMPNPYLSIATRALGSCLKLWPELGLTPSSRARISLPPDATDGFGEFDTLPPAPGRPGRRVQ